jgi:hypothetical protein
MANICTTRIKIEGTEEAIEYFRDKYDNCNDGRYPNIQDTPHIVDVFGADAELFIDKVGTKWVQKGDVIDDSEDIFEFTLESANYPPSDMMGEIHRQLLEIDPNINISGRYWDETFDPCGVFKILETGDIITNESSPDTNMEDFEGDFYWDDIIEPLFSELLYELE